MEPTSCGTSDRLATVGGTWPTPWPDCSVRRVFDADPNTACRVAAKLWAGADSNVIPVGEYRLPAVVRVHRWKRPVPVEVVVTRWSRTKTELRLEVRTMTIPAGYFDRAHEVADVICDQLRAEIARRNHDRPLARPR